jgi:hypothetical protein
MAHDQEVMGLNPCTVYWMNVSDYINSYTNITKKVAEWGTPKKNIKKKK